ncbi:LuxR C-terminal-related transcriptional regulator [Streptomyces canus]|uniref:helix-turn-helix transcriptional regulator n=1 Tax=Streptomyces canus TaxID=58343 RepID=UPI003248655A
MDEDGMDRVFAQLTEDSAELYLYALRTHGIDEASAARDLGMTPMAVRAAIEPLLGLRLLRRSDTSGDLHPVRPDIAAAELAAPLEERIRAQTQRLGQLRDQVLSLLPAYEEHRSEQVESWPVDRFRDAKDVRSLLRVMAAECREEVVTVQPGGARDPQVLMDALPRDIAMLDRGVRMRVLHQHTARGDMGTRAYVSKLVERGAEVRTTAQIAERLIVFDGGTAFLPDRDSASKSPGATVVRDPVVVKYLLRLFEQTWQEAVIFDVSNVGYQDTVKDLRLSILRLMARGLSDESVARRMGMALRTCRRHIAAITQELGAVSRFQAGVLAQQRGFLGAVGDPMSAAAVPESPTGT